MLRKVPLIVILGSTGTGKTKLSLELAERFGGEIISADSMQVYRDLDVVTAKATKSEQSQAKHHLLDVAHPAEPFTVIHFRNAALPIINQLFSESKSPIVVGGTNYYIESLLWDILVSPAPSLPESWTAQSSSSTPSRPPPSGSTTPPQLLDSNLFPSGVSDSASSLVQIQTSTPNSSTKSGAAAMMITTTAPIAAKAVDDDDDMNLTPPNNVDMCAELDFESFDAMPSDKLYAKLKEVDPLTANRIHPNNRRKILRALEVFDRTGVALSAILSRQRSKPGGNRLGGPLRYPHTILLWLRCNQEVLNGRLDKRVDSMLEQGLLTEVRNFYNKHVMPSRNNEYTKGILQSIGFKEFVPYLENFDSSQDFVIQKYLEDTNFILSTKPLQNEPQGLDLLRKCLNELKLVTRRYSKKQIKWINNRFLGSSDRQVPTLYALDTSDIKKWDLNVTQPAIDVIESYMNEKDPKLTPLEKIVHPSENLNEEVSNYCDICKRHFIGEFQWEKHLKSNKHKRIKDGQRRKEKLQIENNFHKH